MKFEFFQQCIYLFERAYEREGEQKQKGGEEREADSLQGREADTRLHPRTVGS